MGKLPSFVTAAPVVVIYVNDVKPPDLDLVLAYFKLFARVAWIRTEPDTAVSDWLATQNTRLGRAGSALPPGYYLFKDGQACRYQTGLVDPAIDRFSLGVGAIAGVIAIMSLDVQFIETAVALAHAQAAARVIGVFLEALGDLFAANANTTLPPPEANTPPPPASAPAGDLVISFRVLGIPATATHAQVKARYRELAKEWHPDRCAGDAKRARDADRQMSQINVAYATVCGARGW